MSTDRDVTRIVRSWLEEGVTALPDRVLDTVLDQLPATHQRRARWPARRLREMITPTRIAMAAAAIAAFAVVSINVLPERSRFGGPDPSPSPSPTPSPIALPGGVDLEAGTTYYIGDPGSMAYVFTVPAAGWFTIDNWFLGKNDSGAELYDVALLPAFVGNLHADPCHWDGSALDPAVGPTVDDLATAFMEQAPQNASAVSDVIFGDYAGKKVEMSIPDDVDTATCDDGDYGRWYADAGPSTYGPFTYGEGQRDTVYIVDVEGTRVVIDTIHLPGTSEADLAELEQLVASLRFERLASPTPSPSPSP